MQVLVGTSVVNVSLNGRGRPVIQNLGPGDLAIDSEPTVTMESGFILTPGQGYEFASASSYETGISMIADAADTDVRVIWMGV